jgi:hypothetical protein
MIASLATEDHFHPAAARLSNSRSRLFLLSTRMILARYTPRKRHHSFP